MGEGPPGGAAAEQGAGLFVQAAGQVAAGIAAT